MGSAVVERWLGGTCDNALLSGNRAWVKDLGPYIVFVIFLLLILFKIIHDKYIRKEYNK